MRTLEFYTSHLVKTTTVWYICGDILIWLMGTFENMVDLQYTDEGLMVRACIHTRQHQLN